MKDNRQPWGFLPKFEQLLALLLCFYTLLSPAFADEWHFQGVRRIVAVGDVHGAFDDLVATLQVAGVIDSSQGWNGGDTHLVMTGDLLDRGAESRQVMDLIMRLEKEAALAGGQVHLLLGNHEVMNLIGDLRYVATAEYAAFIGDESLKERKRWYQRFRSAQAGDADEATLRAEFDKKAPPGYFGHRRAFRNDGYYGKWLLEKPLMIVVNDTAFAHGGAPPYVAEHGLAGVNGALKLDLINYVTAVSTLEDAGVLSPLGRFREQSSILTAIIEAGQLDASFAAPAREVVDLTSSSLHGPIGPLWYRGTASCPRLVEGDDLNEALGKIGASRIVNGHTTTSMRRVQQRLDGRVILVDTGMLKESYQGSGNALIIEGEMLEAVNQDGSTGLKPIVLPGHVGVESREIDEETLANILVSGSIVKQELDGKAWNLVQVVEGDHSVFAYFNALPGAEDFVPEIAAFRLDRMLGLYMVPVTVFREIAGQSGTLQYVPEETISERARVTGGKGDHAQCSPDKQKSAMYIFDTLINNPERTPLSMLYNPDDWQLILINHRNSLGPGTIRPDYLRNVELSIGGEWRSALLTINDEKLHSSLGDVLDNRRLDALAERRDALIKKSIQ